MSVHVHAYVCGQSLESLRAAEEARSKRHSTSELGSITLTDVRKDGWLHYKQILTEKGKVRSPPHQSVYQLSSHGLTNTDTNTHTHTQMKS